MKNLPVHDGILRCERLGLMLQMPPGTITTTGTPKPLPGPRTVPPAEAIGGVGDVRSAQQPNSRILGDLDMGNEAAKDVVIIG
ncbi:MAG TPA: hypothetical protein PKA37_16475, partial [Planctomycetota bacterium]|nr:hypothetical protein [Planctomycetota bacterium]